ncbi:hypothetical protein NQ176_g1453 [Zarea fungicola]|uniref:Uncharacterized protein n=1 Tax=Zarea fungicola TaxID=93591 RepID=A0ACC1NVH4_9HYPO|nr:hypothetical protein NQ176_g1453 [Lecanicillium fungicola]
MSDAAKALLSTLLRTVEDEIIPLTRDGVSSGSKVFGAAILSRKDLKPLTVATNNERISPLLHGEINCIQEFFTKSRSSLLVDYLSDFYFHSATKDEIRAWVNTYSSSIVDGSPFRTGILNELYPGFKRNAAFLGDYVFTLMRRNFLQITAEAYTDLPTWSYLASYDWGTPIMGTFHTSDILQLFYNILPSNAADSARTYYYNFLYNLDPNRGVTTHKTWPQWKENKQLMWFKGIFGNDLLTDDFRADASKFLGNHTNSFRI